MNPNWENVFLPHFGFQAGNTGKQFNDLSQATSWFSSGREEWVECIDVWKQTTALCVPERPDMRRNEPWDNQIDCKKHNYTCIM